MGKWQRLLYVFFISMFMLTLSHGTETTRKVKHYKTYRTYTKVSHRKVKRYKVHYARKKITSSKTRHYKLPILQARKSLKGNKNSLIEENEMADREGLNRISNDATLTYLQRTGALVPLPENAKMKIDSRLADKSRWCRPWVPVFLADFSSEYYKVFHIPLKTNSAIRTVEFQTRLRKTNPNAAPPYGPTASTHLTGATIDIAKKDMSQRELAWVRNFLLQKIAAGKIHVIEEFHQSVFHIMVSKYYKTPENNVTKDNVIYYR